MKKKLLLAVATSLMPAAASAQDASAWAGPYIGLQAGVGKGDQAYDPSSTYDLDGQGFGIYGGYLWTSGAWAFGGELAYARTDYAEVDQATGEVYPAYDYPFTLDLKARAGYAMGSALIYGVLGYGFSEYQDGSSSPGNVYDIEAPFFGLGLDYMVSDQFTIGAEVLRRNLDVDGYVEADLTTVTLRAGMKF